MSNIIADSLSGKWFGQAESTIKNKQQTLSLINDAERFTSNDKLREVWENIKVMGSYVRDVVSGAYPNYDGITLVKIVAALIYLVSPVDLIPDFVPVLGFTDDAAVLVYVYKSVTDELNRYRAYRKLTLPKTDL